MNGSETTEIARLLRSILQMEIMAGLVLFAAGLVMGIALMAGLLWVALLVVILGGLILWGSISRLKVALEELYWAQANADDDPHPREY